MMKSLIQGDEIKAIAIDSSSGAVLPAVETVEQARF